MSTVVSPGFSPAAKFLNDAKRAALKQFRQSASFSKQSAYDQLGEVYETCREADWDGDGTEPIEQDTLRNAYVFIEALPDGYPLPDITAEPDGHLDLEWYRHPRRILSVSVSPEGMLYWAALVGTEDPRGSCPFYGDIPDTILYWIRRVCAG
jgi:hypothetical protein